MGCFSTCFPKSKRPRSRRPVRATPCFDQSLQRVECFEALQIVDVKGEGNADKLIDSVCDSKDGQTENLNISGRKKVTFDLNVKIFEELATREKSDGDLPVESSIEEEQDESEKEKETMFHSESSSSSSLICIPPNRYRYQNCRDSDDELDDNDYMGDDDSDEDDDDDHPESSFSLSADSTSQKQAGDDSEKEINSPVQSKIAQMEDSTTTESDEDEEEDSVINFNTVLNPVENLTQWKSIKARSKLSTQNNAKENNISGPISEEPTLKSTSARSKNSQQEIAVDTSLSTWLAGPEAATPTKSRTSSVSVGNSPYSGSPRDFDDRPILGALTLEEIRQLKADSTPRRSPNRSPEDMPIIGSVGSYWSPTTQRSSAGYSTTRSKYMEGRRVNLTSSPFEKRLGEGI